MRRFLCTGRRWPAIARVGMVSLTRFPIAKPALPVVPTFTPMHTLEDLRAGKLAGTRRLDLSAGLTEFPEEIFDLADSLEILNLSGNQLSALAEQARANRNHLHH